MRVACKVRSITVEGDFAPEVDAVRVQCTREGCNGSADALGRSTASVRFALALLRDTCPRGEANFYVDGREVKAANRGNPRLIDLGGGS